MFPERSLYKKKSTELYMLYTYDLTYGSRKQSFP